MSVYLKIIDNYKDLTKAEQKIAKYCIDNFFELQNYTLASLASATECGEATIFRFCQKNGFDTFLDFKNSIKDEIHANVKLNEETFLNDIHQSIHESIDYVISNIDTDEFEEIAKLIFDSRRIFCAGAGNSGIPAEAFAMRLLRHGKEGIFFKDNNFQLIYLYQLDQNDVAVLFSASGSSIDTILCAEVLQKRGIKIVAITSSLLSPLAQMADYHIVSHKLEGPIAAGSMISQISQIYIADALTTRIAMFDQKLMIKAKECTYDYVYKKNLHN